MNDLARFFALERRLLELLSTRIEPFEHGTAFLDEEFRDRYNSNFLLVEQSHEGVPAEAILEEAERILGGASYPHREVVVRDDRHGERLAPAFAEHRYTVERNVIMVHRRAPTVAQTSWRRSSRSPRCVPCSTRSIGANRGRPPTRSSGFSPTSTASSNG